MLIFTWLICIPLAGNLGLRGDLFRVARCQSGGGLRANGCYGCFSCQVPGIGAV